LWTIGTTPHDSRNKYSLPLNDIAFFESQVSKAIEGYKETPVIKPSDLKRSDTGVHWRGVVLFYEIYKKYGHETIITILQVLAKLKIVATSIFLDELKAVMGDEIPNLIEQSLTKREYNL